MRLPTSKIYRAFSELDGFNDAQCQLLMQRVRLEMSSRQTMILAVIGVALAVMLVMWPIMNQILEILKQHNPRWAMAGRDLWRMWVWTLGVVLPATVAGFYTRDTFMRKLLVRAINVHIERVRCPQCKYILIGQRDHNGSVTCPECGHTTLLHLLGLEPADLIPPDSALAPLGRELRANPALRTLQPPPELESDRFKF